MRLKVRLAYRGDLAFGLLADAIVTTVGLVAIATLFHHVPDIEGYELDEVLLCWGFAEASLGTYWMLFQGLYAMNREYILDARMDRCLLRPLDPYLQILLDHFKVEAFGVVSIGLGVIAVAAWRLGLPWSWLQLGLVPVFVVSGALVVGGVLTGLSSLGFWLHHQGSAIGLAYQFTAFARYPAEVFPRAMAALFLTLVPFSFVGFVPATFYMRDSGWAPLALLQPVVGIACMVAGYSAWRFGLRRYASSGH